MASCQEPEETELRVRERRCWVRFIQVWLWLQQDGGEGCLRQAEQDAQAGLWSCAMDAAGIPHGAVHPAAVGLKEGAEEEPVLQPAANPCVPGAVGQQQCPALPGKAALRH